MTYIYFGRVKAIDIYAPFAPEAEHFSEGRALSIK